MRHILSTALVVCLAAPVLLSGCGPKGPDPELIKKQAQDRKEHEDRKRTGQKSVGGSKEGTAPATTGSP